MLTSLKVEYFLSHQLIKESSGPSMPTEVNELKWAAESLSGMETASDLLQYEKCWKDFLAYLERFWEKVKNSGIPSLTTQISQVGYQRKNDELLKYLVHARNSNEHTIRPILSKIDGAIGGDGTSVIAGDGGGTIIRGVIEGGKAPTDLVWQGNLTFRFGRDRLEVIDVVERNGQTCAVPSRHIGQVIGTKVPHELAKLGFDFYRVHLPGFL